MPCTDSQLSEVVPVLLYCNDWAQTYQQTCCLRIIALSGFIAARLHRYYSSIILIDYSADVTVELAVCCLLLGDSEKAEDVLGLGPASPPDLADPAIRSFVTVRFACWGQLSQL